MAAYEVDLKAKAEAEAEVEAVPDGDSEAAVLAASFKSAVRRHRAPTTPLVLPSSCPPAGACRPWPPLPKVAHLQPRRP